MSSQIDVFNTPDAIVSGNSTENHSGKPRLKSPIRNQIEIVQKSLDDLLPKEHLARDVWRFVQGMDLSKPLKQILSVENHAGRPATDPKILLTLWLFATLKGISSARLIDEYCYEHDAFKWICGGIKVNYHTISDFRSFQGELIDELLTQTVAILAQKNIISLEAVSQDGMRVRANAGSSSFKREQSLQLNLELAALLVSDLKQESNKDSGSCRTRLEAAQKRAAEEKAKNIEDALKELAEVRKSKIRAGKKELRQVKEEDLQNTRASMTDPEARVMKMAAGGFRPGYNVQFATTNIGKAIIAVDVTNSGSDQKQTLKMIKQVEEKYDIVPEKWLQDAGYNNKKELVKVGRQYKNCKIYMPVRVTENNKGEVNKQVVTDDEVISEWRERMGTEEAQEIYKERASTAEYVNAIARNRGLQQFLVRGSMKVKAVALLFALTHNMMLMINSW
jgi:transposase